jgi:hypothetical protein
MGFPRWVSRIKALEAGMIVAEAAHIRVLRLKRSRGGSDER